MRTNRGGLTRRDALCPECGYIFSISYQSGVRRFKAALQRCPECDHVGRRGSFRKPGLEDYDNAE